VDDLEVLAFDGQKLHQKYGGVWFSFTTIPQKKGPGRIGGYCWYGGYCCSGAAKTGDTSSAEIVSVSVEKRPKSFSEPD